MDIVNTSAKSNTVKMASRVWMAKVNFDFI